MKKMMQFFALGLSMVFLVNAYADNEEICPAGSSLQFHELTTKYIGYWSGITSAATVIESLNIAIPNQFYSDGFIVQYAMKNAGPGYISCYYYLQDIVTGVRTPYIDVSSSVHH